MKKFIKPISIYALIIIGLLYVNSVIYHLWLIGGPPTDNIDGHWKLVYLHGAISIFCFFTAFLLFRSKKQRE